MPIFFDILQIVIKAVFIAVIFYVALILISDIWQADINFKMLANPQNIIKKRTSESISFIPTIRNDAFYQDGKMVAVISGVKIDKQNDKIVFDRVKSFSLEENKEFDFQKYRLKWYHTHRKETVNKNYTGGYDKFFYDFHCKIIGRRKENF